MTTETDSELAARLATTAGELLLDVRASGALDLGRAGDLAAQEFLAAQLKTHRGGDAVLSEEAADDPARLRADRVWIIDPLDGTREFATMGRTDWAVHVALWQRGELVAGAVALPALGTTFATGTPLPRPAPSGRIRIAVSRTRAPSVAARVASTVDGELVPMGSAGAKAMAVLTGEVDAYLHAGGQYEWDSAAPVAVAKAAGLHASRLDGSDLVYNRPDPRLPDLLICRPDLAAPLLAAVEVHA